MPILTGAPRGPLRLTPDPSDRSSVLAESVAVRRSLAGGIADSQPTAAPGSGAGAAPDEAPKYDVENLIAEGAEGRVFSVIDRDLRRRVAMKVLRTELASNPRHSGRFLDEARRTASLEHAGVPAVHDIGYTATGELFFTMRLVEGRTLRDVFTRLRDLDADAQREWTVVRLVQVLQRVAAAVDYAHSRGLLHRDLKPENIALGEYDEVLVLDWGLSKRVRPDDESPLPPEPLVDDLRATQYGAVKGTPLYMPPEQARGQIDVLDERVDIFALGAILYEALCLEPPYEGRSVERVLEQARRGEITPPDRRVRGRDLPRVLVDTSMKALAAEPELRHPSARAFADDLQAFLEGTREKELRRAEAERLREAGQRLEKRTHDLNAEAARLAGVAAELRQRLAPWAPPDEKAALWNAEDAAARARTDAADAHARATDLVARALALDPENASAREALSRFYFERFLHAERSGNRVDAAWLARMVERYNDGPLDEALRDSGCIVVDAVPAGCSVTLVRLTERGRRVLPGSRESLGSAPVTCEALPSGSYVVEVACEGRETARVPLRLRRGERRAVHLRLPPAGAVPPGFVWVPGGPFPCGADAVPADVPDFLVAERPVLLREYAAWLDDMAATDPEAAAAHVPWVESHGEILHVVDGRHVFCPASPFSRRPLEGHDDLPVVGVTRTSAVAYAEWVSARTGRVHVLPNERQWEKAARGADARAYPWGDSFDATFCSMIESTAIEANLRPVGAFPADVSPYGVADMAGNVREWCSDDVDEGRRLAVCRGGAWYLRARECTTTSRWILDADTRNPGIGFRLCIPSMR